MPFEILRLMAREYADRHKEPQALPATIDTLAYAYQRICQGEEPWTALGIFSNACYGYAKHIRANPIKDPLSRPERETERTRQWGLSALPPSSICVNSFSYPARSGRTIPTMCWQSPGGICCDDLIQTHRNTSVQLPHRRFPTNIFCSNRLYQNKYEMYKWIGEAIAKGMTDVHEIQRYARQKQISLYGA